MQTVFPDVKKIAVFRATALGDLIFALPALEALHCTYPQAELVYLGREWHTRFLPGRLPGAHRVAAVPPPKITEDVRRGLVIDPGAEEAFFAQMRAEKFDLALQMHGGGEYSNPFVRRLGARFSVGLKSAQAEALDRWLPYVYYQNEVARMLEVAALAGAKAGAALGGGGTCLTDLQPRLAVLESDLAAAAAEAAPLLEGVGEPFVVLHPGSTDPRRCWAPEKFAAAANHLAGQGLRVALTGKGADAARVQAVKAAMHAPAIDLSDRLSLGGLVGLLSQAALFIGNDSGPLHLALAAGAPAVGLFWAEYVINSLPLGRERFYPLIAWQRTCPHCGRYLDKQEADTPGPDCTHEVSFIEEITPEQVIQGAEVVLAATTSTANRESARASSVSAPDNISSGTISNTLN